MKKSYIVIGVVLVVLFAIYRIFAGSYNNMVNSEETVSQSWSQVQNVYQRRLDLIPNLVNTVKGMAASEKETFEAVINARAKATAINIDPSKLTPEQISKFQAAQGELSTALGRLMVVSEQYPQLRQSEGFLNLQAQLEGTENRISVERKNFNEAVQTYNTLIRQFPNNMLAGIYGFEKKGYFEAEQNADKAPKVQF
ncbi:MAG TPA: LemA family protein [Cytophagales bacterium]|nr:LemA family protein [Cytophagales bacterium]